MSTYDLSIWPITGSQPYNKKIAGAAKLVQRFLIELLTPYGSDVYRPRRGTIFLTEWRRGITTEARLLQVFALSERQARVNLNAEETNDDPDDERYIHTSVTKIEIDKNVVRLYLAVESRDGVAGIVVPLNVT